LNRSSLQATFAALGKHGLERSSGHWRPLAAPFEPGPALIAAALATTTIKVGNVFDNDFRHPALLAKVAASIDVLSGGRLEFMIGAGWMKTEYDQIGIPFDPPGVRVGRLQEAVQIIKGLWADGPFRFSGRHYTISGLDEIPKPLQRPHPRIFVGGGGKRLLSMAAREADIVGFLAQALPGGGLDMVGLTEPSLAEKVGWVREAAGERFDRIELSMIIWNVVVTDDRQAAAERLAGTGPLTAEQVLASSQFLLGTTDEIIDSLRARREQYGIAYFTIMSHNMEMFAPIVAQLAGR
jgi:probable F420-dependent oxidoreductase